jgi:hypothetical protein
MGDMLVARNNPVFLLVRTHSRLQLVQQRLCLFQIERVERSYFRCPALGKVACSLQLSRRRLHQYAQGVVDLIADFSQFRVGR